MNGNIFIGVWDQTVNYALIANTFVSVFLSLSRDPLPGVPALLEMQRL